MYQPRSFEACNDLPESRALRIAPVFYIAIACFTGAFFIPHTTVSLGLVMGAGILALTGLVLLVQRGLIARRGRRFDVVATKLVVQDPEQAFLTDATGQIHFANKAVERRFGACVGRKLEDVFADIWAHPAPVLQRLHMRAATVGSGKEDIMTRAGHFRLSVSCLTDNRFLWRFDELDDRSVPGTRATDWSRLPALTVGATGVVLYANDALRTMIGCRPENLLDVIEDLPICSGDVHRIKGVDGPVPAMVAELRGDADRQDIFLLTEAVGLNQLQGPRALGAGWDAIEDLPVPLLKIAADGRLLASNKEARLLLNQQSTEGQRVADILDGLGGPINDWLREASEGRGGHASQFLRGRGENQDTFVQVTLNIAGHGADRHLIAVLNDVTELKTLEAQFVQSQKMQAIGQLAGGVAHDFNNLLTAISGHCDLLLLRHDEGDQNYADLIQIHQNANRAASLVGQLLAYSRKQNLQPEILDLRDTLSDLTHLLNRLVGEKVVLTLNHDPALSQIKADKRQLEQVLMNLVVNARDAMPAGGEIKVVTENLVLKEPMARDRAVVPPGEYVLVKVIDEGHGIPPEKLPKIFEPFYTTKRTGEGTGLGLSTAYGIVKQTGGYIFAESEVDRGTQFSLLFPSYDLPVAEPVAVPPKAPQMMANAADGVVLLVEDEAPVRAFASRALRLRGYTVLEADCAEAALEMLENDDLYVDLFVTDVIMPGKDGPTWVREALQNRPDTKVVFVSGYAEDAFGDDQSRIPNSVFLPKPFSLNDLTLTVQAQMQEVRASA